MAKVLARASVRKRCQLGLLDIYRVSGWDTTTVRRFPVYWPLPLTRHATKTRPRAVEKLNPSGINEAILTRFDTKQSIHHTDPLRSLGSPWDSKSELVQDPCSGHRWGCDTLSRTARYAKRARHLRGPWGIPGSQEETSIIWTWRSAVSFSSSIFQSFSISKSYETSWLVGSS